MEAAFIAVHDQEGLPRIVLDKRLKSGRVQRCVALTAADAEIGGLDVMAAMVIIPFVDVPIVPVR